MAKSKKKQQSSSKKKQRPSKKDLLRQLNSILAEANAQQNPLDSLAPAFLSVPLASSTPSQSPLPSLSSFGEGDEKKDNDTSVAMPTPTNDVATIHHYTSSNLPPSLHEQCLELFQTNMGSMYQRSEWGLDMDEKERELRHQDVKFLVVVSSHRTSASDVTTSTADVSENDNAVADLAHTTKSNDNTEHQNQTLLGFAHFRYEPDDDHNPTLPITYLYELQIHPAHQSLGLGKKITTIIELLSLKMGMKKIMLTVFKENKGAMRFYERRKYVVDDISPSNFEGEEECGYEILSKSLGVANCSG